MNSSIPYLKLIKQPTQSLKMPDSFQFLGPFKQVVTLTGLPLKGSISEENLRLIPDAGILVKDEFIAEVGNYETLIPKAGKLQASHQPIANDLVLLPGFIDCHTHICFAGSRASDYALRNAGKSYLDIAKAGGGIWHTVTETRKASREVLEYSLNMRVENHLHNGVTTVEVKSGYGLNLESELKILRTIQSVNQKVAADLVSTCLAAHILPRDFKGGASDYLNYLIENLLPILKQEKLSDRIDIFIEQTAFDAVEAGRFLNRAKQIGFQITVHADQFSRGGSKVAVAVGAKSADHLEASAAKEIELLAASNTVAVVLPGASLGLGMPFAPARKLLDAGCCLAIASDWNPGSAPMGDLLTQAALLGAFEKLNTAEVFSGLTFRAAHALGLEDRGRIQAGMKADFIGFACADNREILYRQGKLKPEVVWKNGVKM